MPQPMSEKDIQKLKQLWGSQSEVDRRAFVKEILRIFDNDWLKDLDLRLKELFLEQNYQKIRQRADISINLLKWLANELGSIYSKPATRTIDGQPIDDAYLMKGALDDALDQAARLNFVTREILLRPLVVTDVDKNNENQKTHYMVVDVVTPDKVFVIPHPEDLTRMSAIVLQLPKGGYVIWTDDNYYKLSRTWEVIQDPENPDFENPYGMIPYVACHAVYPTRHFWHHKETTGLREATYSVGIGKTDHNHLRHHQSHKQIVITADDVDKDFRRILGDSSTAMHIRGDGASAQVLDMQVNLREHFETLMGAAQAVLALYGINPQAVRGTLEAQSGYALELKMHKQEQVWDSYRRSWSRCEKMLYDVAQVVWEVDGPGGLPEGEIDIDYPEIGPGRDPKEVADLVSQYLADGLISKKEAMRRIGMTDEQIELMEQEILEESASRAPLAPTPSAFMMDDIISQEVLNGNQ